MLAALAVPHEEQCTFPSGSIQEFVNHFSSVYPCRADMSLLAAGAIVFGAQRLIPSYKESYADWYPKLIKPKYVPLAKQNTKCACIYHSWFVSHQMLVLSAL